VSQEKNKGPVATKTDDANGLNHSRAIKHHPNNAEFIEPTNFLNIKISHTRKHISHIFCVRPTTLKRFKPTLFSTAIMLLEEDPSTVRSNLGQLPW
jgi:hypothetical protein